MMHIGAKILLVLALSASSLSAEAPLKYVITGGPSSGKTSTLLQLEAYHDEHIVPESAKDSINLGLAQGKPAPWEDNDAILALQIKREALIQENEKARVFLDRCPIDVLAYVDRFEQEANQLLIETVERIQNDPTYSKTVFLIEGLGVYHRTDFRVEDLEEAARLERVQAENYERLGFKVVRIPAASVEERAQMILAAIEEAR